MPVKNSETYTTVGGWSAVVVWVSQFSHVCYVIHKPNTKEESPAMIHNKYDGKSITAFSINEPPRYDKPHPSDLVIPLE